MSNTSSIDAWSRTFRGVTATIMLCALAACGGGDGAASRTLSSATGGTASSAASGSRAHALAANLTTVQAVTLPQGSDPLFEGLVVSADAAVKGMWSTTQSWPLNGLHAALLPTGQVLTYGTPSGAADNQAGRTFDVWNPALGFGDAAHNVSFDVNRLDSFCTTAAYLGDGRMLITGGNAWVGSSFFDSATAAVSPDKAMATEARWYATMLTLPDGRPVILGGMQGYNEGMINNPDAAIANGTVSMTPEIYTPGVGWRSLTGARSRDAFGPDYLRASYPRAWVAPNGSVFGLSSDTLWSMDVAAAGGAGAVTVYGKFKTPASNTAPVNVGATSSAVMFAPGRILQAGGNGYFNGDGYVASNMATVIDINGGAPVVTETAPMAFARRYINTVVLPDGKVLATGGTRVGNNGGSDAVYEAELWNPQTGSWSTGARAAQIRVYHSDTLLLPNGTVLSTGGGAPGPVNNLNAEVYYPPYLFTTIGGRAQLAARPVMNSISALAFTHGASATVQMTSSAAVGRVVLLGAGMVTHSFNTTQRWQSLNFTQKADLLNIALPASANLAPPGYYQLVVLDATGVPSRAVILALGMGPNTTPVMQRNAVVALDAVSKPGNSVALDANGLAVLTSTSEASTPATAQFTVRDGMADAKCVSLESVLAPGVWLRQVNFRLQAGWSDGSDAFKSDATFCPEPGLSGSGVTLRSKTVGSKVLRHRNGEIWNDSQTSDAGFVSSASFSVRRVAASAALPLPGPLPAKPLVLGSAAIYMPNLDASGLSFSWNYGDGSAATAFNASSVTLHLFWAPGLYPVTLTIRNAAGAISTKTFFQAVYRAPTTQTPQASTAVLLEPRGGGGAARLWVVNPDNDSVSVFDTGSNARVAEIPTGAAPRTLARAADGSIWVVNRDAASITIIDAGRLAAVRVVSLPRASQPWGLVIAADGSAYVTLEATGQLLKLNGSTGAAIASVAVGSSARHLAVSADSARILVSRFITPALAGEGTATVDTRTGGGQVVAVDAATLAVQSTILLRHSDKTDGEIQGSGIPNYLGAPMIAPDGLSAWVPSKQDNIARGALRNGQALNFQNTVRAISSRIDMATLTETANARVDHDNAGLASAAAYNATGNYLFVALETSRQVEVIDAIGGKVLFRIEVGLAPQGLAVSADGTRLYVHNFMSRSVSVIDISPLTQNGELRSVAITTLASVATDQLAGAVLRGKQLFYDARDARLARDSYLSCASCHNDGGHDGRTWDMTSLGEGLRNTTALRGRAGTGQGFMHWSANFDEVQDFEGQIRTLSSGTGLMTDALFNAGTRNTALGDKKAGLSADLDALAAYVGSLSSFAPSPYRNADGTLTAAAQSGKAVFAVNCGSCHGGAGFTSSADGSQLKNVGTLKATSGNRLGGVLTGIDIPTLRDVWSTAPYLHDGSAPTLAAAVSAHNNVRLSATDLANVVAYVQQIGSDEPVPAANLAQGKRSTQSSLAFGGDPARAVDGNTDGNYLGNSVSHTDGENQPWWQVDLGVQSSVQTVQVFNRTDCCADQLANVFVLVSANDMTGKTLVQLANDPTVFKAVQFGPAGGVWTVPANVQGRYVRVQLLNSGYLMLSEVKVLGTLSSTVTGKAPTQ